MALAVAYSLPLQTIAIETVPIGKVPAPEGFESVAFT